ncbi:MAG: glycosyltransferase family 2 protein [Gammaproteobacteria bacterium]|nr:glycosyltransferase family 2 protein [Gammaproteobacteria bacterium]MBQ0840679.1 glycosyltransferase family 2 protein [Gammaproteobacteria bacterium]
MKVSIIILNWNGGEDNCAEAVASAMAQSYDNKEIVFVDNGSTDGSGLAIKARYGDLLYVGLPENVGCPPGRNLGAEYANGELLFFLENDGAWDDVGLVASAVELFNKQPLLGAVYTRVEGYATGSLDLPLDPKPAKDTCSGLYLSSSFRGGASIIRSRLFTDCGGFPSDFFRQAEERFMALMIYDRGFKVAYWPEYSLRHKGSDYSGKAAAVASFGVENSLKTNLRLYPVLPGLVIGLSKFMLGMLSLLKAGLYKESVMVSATLFKELFGRRQYQRVSKDCFCEVETLRQGLSSSLDVDRKTDKAAMSVLLFKRFFAGA